MLIGLCLTIAIISGAVALAVFNDVEKEDVVVLVASIICLAALSFAIALLPGN